AGADPNRYADDADEPAPLVYAAVRTDSPAELVELLLSRGADPVAPGPDGRSPYAFAVSKGRTDLADLLRSYGARADAAAADELRAGCISGDVRAARERLESEPGLFSGLTDAKQGAALGRGGKPGNLRAVTVMHDLGFSVQARGENGGTALHDAAYAGSA